MEALQDRTQVERVRSKAMPQHEYRELNLFKFPLKLGQIHLLNAFASRPLKKVFGAWPMPSLVEQNTT
jgi:hypothetical protein